jgi:hypothetical protein
VPAPARIALRILGLVLLLAAAACVVLLIVPGPRAVAETVGTCSTSHYGPDGPCTTWQTVVWLWVGFCLFGFSGFVLRLVTRPEGKGPLVLDLRRRPRL